MEGRWLIPPRSDPFNLILIVTNPTLDTSYTQDYIRLAQVEQIVRKYMKVSDRSHKQLVLLADWSCRG
jgi:hypothetical protein